MPKRSFLQKFAPGSRDTSEFFNTNAIVFVKRVTSEFFFTCVFGHRRFGGFGHDCVFLHTLVLVCTKSLHAVLN